MLNQENPSICTLTQIVTLNDRDFVHRQAHARINKIWNKGMWVCSMYTCLCGGSKGAALRVQTWVSGARVSLLFQLYLM